MDTREPARGAGARCVGGRAGERAGGRAGGTVVTLLLLKGVDKVLGLRVTEEEERMGLDSTQHGEAAYTS
jgi:hypothetical protein